MQFSPHDIWYHALLYEDERRIVLIPDFNGSSSYTLYTVAMCERVILYPDNHDIYLYSFSVYNH